MPAGVTVQVEPAETQLEALLSSGGRDLQIDLILRERQGLQAARAGSIVDSLVRRLQAEPALTGVRRAEAETVPAVRLRLNREAMARFGARPADVAAYLEAAARGRRATELRQVSEEIPIVVRAREARSVEALLARRIPTSTGRKPLHVFVEAEATDLPAALVRAGQAPVVRLEADVAPGAGLAAATRAVEAGFAATLPPGVRGTVRGANQAFRDGLQAVGWSLLLSLLLVYLILTAQFERLLQPLVILATVPLAASGVAATLWITGQTVNLMSLTGCVVLVGIVVNDAIIKVDIINQRRAAGRSLRAALVAAGRDRVRPILMTTITTALGLVPLALGLGAGAEIRAPLAIAIIGGLCAATALTLFVVPVLVQLVLRETGPQQV
jgi:HAE1 family hydrophobic/amphiphilic exporter-1